MLILKNCNLEVWGYKSRKCSGSLECYMRRERERESQGMLLSYCTLPFLSPQICSWCRDCQSGTSHFILSLCLLPGNFNFGTFCEVYTPCLFPLNYQQGWKHSVIAKPLGLKPFLAIAVGRALRNLSTDGSSPPSVPVGKGSGWGGS